MLRFLMILGFLTGLFSTQADARTIRYEFDITETRLFVGAPLQEYDSPFAYSGNFIRTIPSGDPDYQEIVDSIHPLSGIAGQTGRVAIQVGDNPAASGGVQCVNGLLCSYFEDSAVISSYDLNGFTLFQNFGHWSLGIANAVTGEGRLFFTDDQTTGWGATGNYGYQHGGARADFSLANLAITDVTPVPLPAAAPLSAIGLLAFGIGARRRKRAV